MNMYTCFSVQCHRENEVQLLSKHLSIRAGEEVSFTEGKLRTGARGGARGERGQGMNLYTLSTLSKQIASQCSSTGSNEAQLLSKHLSIRAGEEGRFSTGKLRTRARGGATGERG